MRRAGGVLGAFVYRNDGIVHKLGRVFDLAQQHGLALDFHVDEGLDAEATGLRTIAQLTIARGLQGRVACGHACSLSVQDDAAARDTLALCAQAGIHLIALPTTNLYLQGAWDRTPVQRGITRLREAAAQGLRPSLATDNVQDAFYPYGGYDLVETFGLGVQMAHLAPADRLARRHHRQPGAGAGPGLGRAHRAGLPGRPGAAGGHRRIRTAGPARPTAHRHPRRPHPGERHA